jgi:hypothetical protein
MTLTTHISTDATEAQSGLKNIKILLFLFMCYIIFLNSCNHLPVHDPFYVVFLKAVTCWYWRNHLDPCPQHNPTTTIDWKQTHIKQTNVYGTQKNYKILLFLIQNAFWITTFLLTWCMHIQNNITPQYYVRQLIANKLYSLNCWYYSVVYKKSCSQLIIFISCSLEKIIIPCCYCAPLVPPNLLHTHSV